MNSTRAKLMMGAAALACGLSLAPHAHAQSRRTIASQRGATGVDCASPLPLPDFPAGAPYNEANTTSGKGDDFQATCLDDYDSGEDIIYEFVVTEMTCLKFTVDADTIWAGFAISDDCSDFDSCLTIADTANNPDVMQTVLDAGTYYLIIDTFADPTSTDFDLTIEECPTGACCLEDGTCVEVQQWECVELNGLFQGDDTLCAEVACIVNEGDNCLMPIVTPDFPDDLPYEDSNTTTGRGNNYSATCMGSWDGGEDIIYEINVLSDVCLTFAVEGSTGFLGMALHDSCPIDANSCLATSASFSPTEWISIDLTAGTYYLQIDTFAPPSSVNFDLSIIECRPFGACCMNDGTCMELTDLDCVIMDGSFLGDGITCVGIACPPPAFGACCLGDTCQELFENECDDMDGEFQGEGSLCEDISCPVPPDNDLCANATPVNGGPHAFSTASAGTDGPAHEDCTEFTDNQVNQDVWFKYVAPCSGTLTVSTCEDPDFDTKLAVYQGESCQASELEDNLIACADDTGGDCGTRAQLEVEVSLCQVYLIRVGGFQDEAGDGTLVLDLACGAKCQGDANGDLIVDLDDLLIVIANWGGPGPAGDVDTCGIVDLIDLLTVIANWGSDCN